MSVDCRATSDCGLSHSNHLCRPSSTETKTLSYRRHTWSIWCKSDHIYIRKMSFMQSHGLSTKYLSKVQNLWLILLKPIFWRLPTCSKLLGKFLHLDKIICQKDVGVDQSTNMADDMSRSGSIKDGILLACLCVSDLLHCSSRLHSSSAHLFLEGWFI